MKVFWVIFLLIVTIGMTWLSSVITGVMSLAVSVLTLCCTWLAIRGGDEAFTKSYQHLLWWLSASVLIVGLYSLGAAIVVKALYWFFPILASYSQSFWRSWLLFVLPTGLSFLTMSIALSVKDTRREA